MAQIIADGEYDIEVPETLLAQLSAISKGGKSNQPKIKTDEILSLTYSIVPETLDKQKTSEVTREDPDSQAFQLKAESTDANSEGIFFEGEVTASEELEFILVYNDKLETFELQKVDHKLRTTSYENRKKKSIQNGSGSRLNTPSLTSSSADQISAASISSPLAERPQRRKKPKEANIFAPKVRPKTPLSGAPKLARSSSGNSSDEAASKKTSLPSAAISRPSAPSPLNPQYQRLEEPSPEKRSRPSTAINHRTTESGSSVSTPNSTAPSPRVASKKPMGTAAAATATAITTETSVVETPRISNGDESEEDEDEFGALADELEEELLSDDGFFTIDERSPTKDQDNNGTDDIKQKINGTGPISFRSLAGAYNDDDEDLVSSSEEE